MIKNNSGNNSIVILIIITPSSPEGIYISHLHCTTSPITSRGWPQHEEHSHRLAYEQNLLYRLFGFPGNEKYKNPKGEGCDTTIRVMALLNPFLLYTDQPPTHSHSTITHQEQHSSNPSVLVSPLRQDEEDVQLQR